MEQRTFFARNAFAVRTRPAEPFERQKTPVPCRIKCFVFTVKITSPKTWFRPDHGGCTAASGSRLTTRTPKHFIYEVLGRVVIFYVTC